MVKGGGAYYGCLSDVCWMLRIAKTQRQIPEEERKVYTLRESADDSVPDCKKKGRRPEPKAKQNRFVLYII